MADMEDEYIDEKKECRDITKREIEVNKSDLAQVKCCIEEKFNITLGYIDDDYIKRKYIKYCVESWLEETRNFLNTLTASQSHNVSQEILNSINNIQHLDEIPNSLKQLDYYVLLMKQNKLVEEQVEKNIIEKFKKICLQQMNSHSSCVRIELDFLEAFVEFLNCSKNLQSIFAKLKFKDVYDSKLEFSEFLALIVELDGSTYGASLETLQIAARSLQTEGDLLSMESFKEIIGSYIKPVQVQKTNLENRSVIEVSGKSIVISDVLEQVENALSEQCDVEDVHFVGGEIIHVDVNLEVNVWRGVNIVILTKVLKIYDKVTCNVSGKDNYHIYSSTAGTGEDGHGKQGKDGYPGESGGNVLILADKIENLENLKIVSNGGNGSQGQDGGDGRDGEDGKGISKKEFEEKYPPVAKFLGNERISNVISTIENIKQDSEQKNINVYDDNGPSIITRFIELCKNDKKNVYINAVTKYGNEITFSLQSGIDTANCQAYLLYKGSLGKPGCNGGEYGLGGEGGHPGSVLIRNINGDQEMNIEKGKQGFEGQIGKGGSYGRHGKNGWDMGYTDYSVSSYFTGEWPIFSGEDQSSKLSLEYSEDSTPTSVWCSYKAQYAKINASRIEHTKQTKYEERNNTRQNSDRQRHAQAVRKKAISAKSILANYSHHLNFTGKSLLQNLQSEIKSSLELASQALDNQQSVAMGIKRIAHFSDKCKNEGINNTINLTYDMINEELKVEELITELSNESQLSDQWIKVFCVELGISQLSKLFGAFQNINEKRQGTQKDTENWNPMDINALLIAKYRLATLQEINKQLPRHQEDVGKTVLTAGSVIRYLVEEKEKYSNISHPTLGTLGQYLYLDAEEQRDKIVQFCERELQNPIKEALERAIEVFVFEVQHSEEVYRSLEGYRVEYNVFKSEKETDIKTIYKAIQTELDISGHEKVRNLWMEYISGKPVQFELKREMEKDTCLKSLYKLYNVQRDQKFSWGKFYKDNNFLQIYNDCLRRRGPQSKCYRELLAYVFGINIRLYVKDQHNQLSLEDNHNPSAEKAIHVFCRANEFIQLKFNENYFTLEAHRKEQDKRYASILEEIEKLEGKQEFDDYLKNKAFCFVDIFSERKQDFNDEEDMKQIKEYFNIEEKQQLKLKLEKLSTTYNDQKRILHNVLQRFSSNGRHVSCQAFCFLIDSILASKKCGRNEPNIFRWIIAAHCQRNWTDELILLQLENHFKRLLNEKAKWREYMSKIGNKSVLLLFGDKLDQDGTISIKCIDDILYLLSSIPNATVSLDELKLSEWPYALKEKYWSCKLSSLTSWQRSEKLPTASYYLLSIENTFGTDIVEELLQVLKGKQSALSPDVLTKILANFHTTKWNLSKEELSSLKSTDIHKWEQEMLKKFSAEKEERKIAQLSKLVEGNANTSKNILKQLPIINVYIENIRENAKHGKTLDSFDTLAIHVHPFWINKNMPDIEMDMLAQIDRAIELKRGFKLRDTQKLAVLALLTNERNTLAQVSTGEGKSLIVVAAAIMKALCSQKVDIITSSSVLAKRDAEENKDIYGLFNISVSHNCSEDIEDRKRAYSGNQVVYGELSNFQRDYLLDKFYGKNILGDRNFGNVIVDEVDSMLLDKGNNMLYLSHDLPYLDKLESVYIFIWQWINRPVSDEEIRKVFDAEAIKEAVLSDLYGFIKKEKLVKLVPEFNDQQMDALWTRLVEAQILDDQGKLLKHDFNDDELNRVLSPEFSSYGDRLKYFLTMVIGRERCIDVPNYLRFFVERHLKTWIKSAITAFFMKTGQDYVVDVDRTGTSSDRNPNIIILDRDTGTDQTNSQWDDALHQYLQLKHGCRLSLQSLKAVFISNVSYFKLYQKLYGLTGTLGSQSERNLLQGIYDVDFVTVPTFKPKQFDEHSPILCCNKEEWINQIQGVAKKLTEEKKRSVLIICETVNDVEVLYKAFGGKSAQNVHMYKRDYEAFKIVQGNTKLEPGQIIIATNLAGRGTDIKPSEELEKAGGLHVCLTYLPTNIRIEQQAFGRAARSGDRGSGQLIIMDSKGQEYSSSRILDLKKDRDAEEIYRISHIKDYYETQITMEEEYFKVFKEQYERLEKNLDDKKVPTEIKEILMKGCLDKWAFWLDENSKYMGSMRDEHRLKDKQNVLISELKQLENSDSWSAWIEGNPAQMIKLAKYHSQSEKQTNTHLKAIELFDKVIEKEPVFSDTAHYYKAFTLSKQIDRKQRTLGVSNNETMKQFKEELRKAAILFDKHSNLSAVAAEIIGRIKRKNTESIIQINAFEEQHKSIASLYSLFSQSINAILNHTINPQSFVRHGLNEDLAEIVYNDLLEKGLIKNFRVEKEWPEKDLNDMSSDYGIPPALLQGFLSKYADTGINPKEFIKALKTKVPLPSREAFWKLLIEGKVLRKEIKYVVVDIGRLENTNPSLLRSLIMLEKQTLALEDGYIFLNPEYLPQQQTNCNVYTKQDFIRIVGEDKYKVLKEKGVLSFNRKARLDPSQMKSFTFPCYDAITLEHFTMVNITKNEAERILAELVENKYVEKKEKNGYKLIVKFDEIEQFSFFPYQNSVNSLLSVCFAFRIELQRIVKQLYEKDFPIQLQMKAKPHRDLFWDLYDRKVIAPPMVAAADEGLEEMLKSIFSETMSERAFKCMLSKDLLISEQCTEKLYHCLIEKNWISEINPIQRFQNSLAGHQADPMCEINTPYNREIPLGFSPDSSPEKNLFKSSSFDKELEIILNRRLYLANIETIEHIVNTLRRSRSILNTSEVSNCQLKRLTEFHFRNDVVNIEELHIFSLNGLGHLIQLEEERWTLKMLLSTTKVVGLGIFQIAIAAVLMPFTAKLPVVGPMLAPTKAALVAKGVSDLHFAVGAFKSGYFSWKDYGQHTIQWLIHTATTLGLRPYLSTGANLFGFGHLVASSSYKIKTMTRKRLIETAGNKFGKRNGQQAADGIAFSLNNAGTDKVIENILQTLAGGVAAIIRAHIGQELERHNISKTLEKACNTLREESLCELNELVKSIFTEYRWVEKFRSVTSNIPISVIQGIAKAVEYGSKSNKLELPNLFIKVSIVWAERVSQLANIQSVTGSFLNDLDKKMNENLDRLQSKAGQPDQTRKQSEELRKEIAIQWKKLLCDEPTISHHIVSPILSEGAKLLVKLVEKKSRKVYRSNQNSGCFEQFYEQKREYYEQMQSNHKN